MGFFSRPKNEDLTTVSEHLDVVPSNEDEKTGDVQLEAAHGSGLVLTPDMERSLVRKMDRRLIPILWVLYLLSYLDRSNIGNAKIAGMSKDLNLSSADYTWLLTIFYIAYIIFEWFALMWKVIPPHIWAAFCVIGWGLVAAAQAGTTSWRGMMCARFFLGFFEAGFGPGVPYLLSFFYLRHEIGTRIGVFLSAASIATCFAGALAYGITSGSGEPLANWRVLFLSEGLPIVAVGVLTFFVLPDGPQTATFLTEGEKEVARRRAVRQVGPDAETRTGGVVWSGVWTALCDPKNYLQAFMYFSCNVSFSSLPVFLPTILNEMGFTAVSAQGLTAPPYFLAFLIVLLSTWVADRTRQRGFILLTLSLVGATGYILLATTSGTGPRYAGVFLAASGIFPAIANIPPWVLNNQGSDTTRGMGIAMLNFVGQCGPLLGTRLYPEGEGPYYRKGMWVCAGFMLFNGFLAMTLRSLLVWENRRRDRREGGGEGVVVQKRGDENEGVGFRFVL